MTFMSAALAQGLETLQGGNFVLLAEKVRENEFDLVLPAQHATEEKLRFILRHGSGMVCVPMLEDRLHALGLKLIEEAPTKPGSCSFYTTVDPRYGGTGMSAKDKLQTITALLEDEVPITHPSSRLARPGHTFPLRTHIGGVLARAGHTEGSIALLDLADLHPIAVICELYDREEGDAR